MTGVLADLSAATISAIAIIAVINVFLITLILSAGRARRADKEAERAGVVDSIPEETAEAIAKPKRSMSRREFFRIAWLSSLGLFALDFGVATLAFLWPNLKGGFGSKIEVGTVADIKAAIQAGGQPFYYGAGRFYIVSYDGSGTDEATGTDYGVEGVLAEGLMPLYQRCVHLGCRVPFCSTSQWFECPCHGTKYNGAGEFQEGPAPRGMDRFKIEVAGGNVSVDTSTVIVGPPRGTKTIVQPPEGPFC